MWLLSLKSVGCHLALQGMLRACTVPRLTYLGCQASSYCGCYHLKHWLLSCAAGHAKSMYSAEAHLFGVPGPKLMWLLSLKVLAAVVCCRAC
eukprot:1160478-Pelagomonas_calceolata.AAC.7